MAITINGSGTITGISEGGLNDDSIAIADLSATGTASSSTFLRGDNTWASAGKILQVKYATKNDTFSTAATSFTDVTGLSVTMDATSTSNKFLYFAFIQGNTEGSKSYGRILTTWNSGASTDPVGEGDPSGAGSRVLAGWDMNHGGSSNRGQTTGQVWAEAVPHTTAVTAKIQVRHENGGSSVYVNRVASATDDASTGRYGSGLIVMEIA